MLLLWWTTHFPSERSYCTRISVTITLRRFTIKFQSGAADYRMYYITHIYIKEYISKSQTICIQFCISKFQEDQMTNPSSVRLKFPIGRYIYMYTIFKSAQFKPKIG